MPVKGTDPDSALAITMGTTEVTFTTPKTEKNNDCSIDAATLTNGLRLFKWHIRLLSTTKKKRK